jgi:hypothetical protein
MAGFGEWKNKGRDGEGWAKNPHGTILLVLKNFSQKR